MTLNPERTYGKEKTVTREEEGMDIDSCLPTDENSSRSKKPKEQGTGEINDKTVCLRIRLDQRVSWIVIRTQKAYSFPKGIHTLNTMFITNDNPFNPVSTTFEKLILFERLIFDL